MSIWQAFKLHNCSPLFDVKLGIKFPMLHCRDCGRALSVGCDIQSSYLGEVQGVCAHKGDNCNTSAHVSASGVITVISMSIISVNVNEP